MDTLISNSLYLVDFVESIEYGLFIFSKPLPFTHREIVALDLRGEIYSAALLCQPCVLAAFWGFIEYLPLLNHLAFENFQNYQPLLTPLSTWLAAVVDSNVINSQISFTLSAAHFNFQPNTQSIIRNDKTMNKGITDFVEYKYILMGV